MPGTDKAARRRRYARYTVFGLMSLFLFIGSAFVIGETFTDPGGWTAVLLVCAWLVPAAALSVYAVLRPAQAERLLLVAVAVVAGFVLVESFTHVIPQNDVGPVATVSAFAMSIPLAFLGLLRARMAGRLLTATGLALAVGALVGTPAGSATVVAVPLVMFGLLFSLVAEPVGGPDQSRTAPPTAQPTH